jgi:glycosyltransferase involved in cell wall biosynthesis
MRYMKLIIPLFIAGLVGIAFHYGLVANLWQEEAARPDFKPRVSLITSLYKGDDFIEQFMEDITNQIIFKKCELIIINANSPGNEEPIIKKYVKKYPYNIRYVRLEKDPGLYAVWNMGIQMARSDLIANANVDDRRNPASLEAQAQILEEDPEIGLVYCPYNATPLPNQLFGEEKSFKLVDVPEFDPGWMRFCLPGPQPMWRKSLHEKYGYFREDFISAADHEMWNRFNSHGVKFKRIQMVSGTYYHNPKGASTSRDPERVKKRWHEDRFIVATYGHLWRV